MHPSPDLLPCPVEEVTQMGTEGVGKADMDDESIAEEGTHPGPCPIEELVRDDDIQRADLLAHAPHRGGGDNPLCP